MKKGEMNMDFPTSGLSSGLFLGLIPPCYPIRLYCTVGRRALSTLLCDLHYQSYRCCTSGFTSKLPHVLLMKHNVVAPTLSLNLPLLPIWPTKAQLAPLQYSTQRRHQPRPIPCPPPYHRPSWIRLQLCLGELLQHRQLLLFLINWKPWASWSR